MMTVATRTMMRLVVLCHLLVGGSAFLGIQRIRGRLHRDVLNLAMASDPNNNRNSGDDDESNNVDAFLDKQIFDPNESDNWFANLVKNDYDSAEALYVGAIGIFGIVLSQELLRMVKYGSSYTPFGSGGGNLF